MPQVHGEGGLSRSGTSNNKVKSTSDHAKSTAGKPEKIFPINIVYFSAFTMLANTNNQQHFTIVRFVAIPTTCNVESLPGSGGGQNLNKNLDTILDEPDETKSSAFGYRWRSHKGATPRRRISKTSKPENSNSATEKTTLTSCP